MRERTAAAVTMLERASYVGTLEHMCNLVPVMTPLLFIVQSRYDETPLKFGSESGAGQVKVLQTEVKYGALFVCGAQYSLVRGTVSCPLQSLEKNLKRNVTRCFEQGHASAQH
jgi:hypothetical protein